jgi:putative exosortase-associated protein (TIGR04073 family)
MKKHQMLPALLIVFLLAAPLAALADQQPEMIVEKMAVKFTRGVANTFTSIVELPKQSILTVRDMGPIGYVVGPVKGIGMTFYRSLIGLTEIIFCVVPQPGYYDSTIDPPYVWQGWEPKRDTLAPLQVENK